MKAPSEKQFMATVVQLAKLMQWRCYHQNDSRQSESGFPDLVMWRGPPFMVRVIVIETKTETGETTEAQDYCLDALQWAIGTRDVRVMRPSDWPEIERMLRDRT